MKNNLSDLKIFYNEKIEQIIKNEVNEINIIAKNLATNYAERQFPPIAGVKLNMVIEEIKARYEKLGIKVCKELQSAVNQPEVATDRLKVEAEIKKTSNTINELENKGNQAEKEQQNLNIEGHYQTLKEVRIKNILFFGAEVLFTSLSFQFFGENLLISILIAIPFTLSVSEYAHLVAMQYKKYTNVLKRRIFLLASILFASLVFFGLSYFRSQALGKEGVSVSTFFFVLINLFIFLVSAFLHYKYSMTKEEKISYHIYKKLKKEKEKYDAKAELLRQHISDMDTQLQDKGVLTLHIDDFAKTSLKEIQKYYEETVGKLKSTNLLLRTDNVIPECFSEATPKLEIDYDFDFYKFNNKEE